MDVNNSSLNVHQFEIKSALRSSAGTISIKPIVLFSQTLDIFFDTALAELPTIELLTDRSRKLAYLRIA